MLFIPNEFMLNLGWLGHNAGVQTHSYFVMLKGVQRMCVLEIIKEQTEVKSICELLSALRFQIYI